MILKVLGPESTKGPTASQCLTVRHLENHRNNPAVGPFTVNGVRQASLITIHKASKVGGESMEEASKTDVLSPTLPLSLSSASKSGLVESTYSW